MSSRLIRRLLLILLTGCSDCTSDSVVLMSRDSGPPRCTCDVLMPGVKSSEPVSISGICFCEAVECFSGFRLWEGTCVLDGGCNAGSRWEGQSCVPAEDVTCEEEPNADHCIPIAEIPPPAEGCTRGCHEGTENAHPWFGGPSLTCSACHGGDPDAAELAAAHVPIPNAWQVNSIAWGRPNLRYYYNYLTLTGVENFEGGLEWLRFRNPGDLRIADQTCGIPGCHPERVENVRRSIMATAAGVIDGSLAASGVPRTEQRDGSIYKWDATRGMTLGRSGLESSFRPSAVGAVARIDRLSYANREFNSFYDQMDLLIELYDKACGDCHLGTAGANSRYGDYRSSGCSACHMVYRLDGRSFSRDEMINKREPTHPQSYTQIAGFDPNDLYNLNGLWLGPERPHVSTHRIVRSVGSRRCGTCHFGSNRTDLQFRGYQVDPDRIAATSLGSDQAVFTGEADSDRFPDARYHGLAREQILDYVDWNDDGFDDIPADIHFQAGLECVDCHTGAEMHGELEGAAGAIWSRMDQATEIECVDCHGNLEHRAPPSDPWQRRVIVCPEIREVLPGYTPPPECQQLGRGRWLKSRLSSRWHYIPQTFDTATAGGATFPSGAPVYTRNAEIFHGRSDAGFSHLGEPAEDERDQMAGGLECYACHATWANNCYGCHLRLSDNGGGKLLHDFSRSTGELTLGQVTEQRAGAISPLDLQYGINAEGKIAQFLPESKQHFAHTDYLGQEYFGAQVYHAYRHRSGYGLRRWETEMIGLAPDSDGPWFDQDAAMDRNAGLGAQPFMPHTVQRSHPLMDCTNCHLDLARSNEDAIAARYGYKPDGFAGVSKYLERARTDFGAAIGYHMYLTVPMQADWCVDRETGFPFCASNHPARVPFLPAYRRDFPGTLTLDAQTSGPLNLELIRKLSNEVLTEDVGVGLRGPR